jgi:hypothetical protein
LKLSVPVPQYADAAQVAKLKAALADALGKPVEVLVEVGPARRTAAALDAAARAARQREAEQEIHGDPFVQQLMREFGARIVDGSVRPLADAAPDGASPTCIELHRTALNDGTATGTITPASLTAAPRAGFTRSRRSIPMLKGNSPD